MSTDIEKELERTAQLRGFRFGLSNFRAQVRGAEHLKQHNDQIEASYLKKGLLDRKAKEMAIIVACVAQGDLVSHLQVHMHAAHKAGATPEEILEMIELVGNWIGAVREIGGLEAWRATFRPDIPTIDRVVEVR